MIKWDKVFYFISSLIFYCFIEVTFKIKFNNEIWCSGSDTSTKNNIIYNQTSKICYHQEQIYNSIITFSEHSLTV